MNLSSDDQSGSIMGSTFAGSEKETSPISPMNNQNINNKPTVEASDNESAISPTSHQDAEPEKELPETTTTANPTAAQDWEGPDDPDNAMNWSTRKKAVHTFATAFLGFAVTCGSSLITPATPEIAAHFGTSRTVAILSLTLFVLGLALGPIIAAPVSEMFGRSVVYKTSAPIFMLFILAAGFSKNIGSLLVCRFFAAMFGGPVLAVGAGTNADMYATKNRAIASSLFIMMPFLGPALGPVIGGFAAQYKGWRWTQWCTIFIALGSTIPIMLTSETYKKIILQRRAKRLGVAPPSGPPAKGFAMLKMLFTITLFRPIHMLIVEPIVALFSLYTAFTFSVLFAFFAAYPYTFETIYSFNTWQYGLAFLGIGLGVLLAVVTAILIDRLYYARHHRRVLNEGKTAVPPEYRLLPAQMGCFGIPIGLFWFAWSARSDVHWISPVLAGIPFAWGNLCIFLSAAMFFIDTYGPLNGASALAANGLLRYGMGAVFPLFTFQMYEALGVGWATSLLAFISMAMVPIPWLFFKYGPQIRARSRFETMKF